jgi:hypothetical protein
LTGELGEHCGFANAGLTAQQHDFPRAAAGHPTRQRIQLRQRHVAFQQIAWQGWRHFSSRVYRAASRPTGPLPLEMNSPEPARFATLASGLARLEQTHSRDMMRTHFIPAAPRSRDQQQIDTGQITRGSNRSTRGRGRRHHGMGLVVDTELRLDRKIGNSPHE